MYDTTTLRQALDAFYKKNAQYFPNSRPTPRAKRFLRNHDVAHVLFGCDTSILGEAQVKLWTILGTSLGFWKHFREYYEASAFELSRKYSWKHILTNVPKIFFYMPRIFIRAKRMTKPWQFSNYERYLDKPLVEIRKEFNIIPANSP